MRSQRISSREASREPNRGSEGASRERDGVKRDGVLSSSTLLPANAGTYARILVTRWRCPLPRGKGQCQAAEVAALLPCLDGARRHSLPAKSARRMLSAAAS